jgi:TolB-like protein
VLYEMVFGVRPFGGESNADVLASILKDEPAWRSTHDVTVPHALGAAIARCLAKERDARFASARAVRTALDAIDASASGLTWPTARTGGPVPIVAVLPVEAPGDDPELSFLAEGIAETLANALSRNPRLRVLPRGATAPCRSWGVDAAEIGRALGATAALSGRVVRCHSTLKVQLELSDVAERRHSWGARYVTPCADLLAAERRITRIAWRAASAACRQLLGARPS